MKSAAFLLLTAITACAAKVAPAPHFDMNLQSRVGFDSNPVGTSGSSAALLGGEDSFTYSIAAGMGLTLSPASEPQSEYKLTYNGEAWWFDQQADENFSTHRFGASGRFAAGIWKFSGEGSTLFVFGARETVLSVSSVNANSITLWRERRRQWQHRAKVQARADLGNLIVRSTGTLLAYDYQTRVIAGKFAFADRSDAQAALDLGWKQNTNSLWLAGVRAGEQNQAIVPLPNCEFDYTNHYYRLAIGWEGEIFANTNVTFAAGPDFRHYSGAIDERAFLGGRNRTSYWFEAGFVSKPSPSLSLTGKAAQFDWLSSTGKSAYVDSSAEAAVAWTPGQAWTMRLTTKLHRCDYFPAIRDDWESFWGIGATVKFSTHTQFTLDLLRQRAWNHLTGVTEREFRRLVVNMGATIKF